MISANFSLIYHTDSGLVLNWEMPNGLHLDHLPVRAIVHGTGSFFVWGEGDPEALAPAWAEHDFAMTCFGGLTESPGISHFIEQIGEYAFRAVAKHQRIEAVLEIRLQDGRLLPSLQISCPREGNARPLPLCSAELRIENLCVGEDALFESAHHYGGGVHGSGTLAELSGRGHAFANGCLGLAFPLVYLYHPATSRGIELEFFTDGRPMAWLRPGSTPACATWAVTWSTERLLQPGQAHLYSSGLSISPFTGKPVAAVRQWRDNAAARYGLLPPVLPEWAHNANFIEFDMCQPAERAIRGLTDMRRADDPRWGNYLIEWRDMGYNVLYLIASNPTGRHSLSPFSYAPAEEIGGAAAEQQLLDLAHELDYRVVLWVTTVGLDMDSPEVKEHSDWWVWKKNGLPYCPFGDYASDANPLSSGWRQWLTAQVTEVISRGYDGIFVDGLTPRDSNQAHWEWPGEARNAVHDLVHDLAAHVQSQQDKLVFIEDENVNMQAASGFTCGRYQPTPPKFKRHWAGIGMPFAPEHPSAESIPPELARDYLAMRYASLLPGVVSCDMIEGYYSDACRVWTAQALLAGCALKTFSTSINEPEIFELVHDNGLPSEEECSAAHRLRGHAEFCELLRFCRSESLLRKTPVSLDGVIVEGDAAVVGLLHASEERCLLALLQFADRPATVRVRLAAPDDVPACSRTAAGHPEQHSWQTKEVLYAMTEDALQETGEISGEQALEISLAAYGFRVLELRPR